jgi:hypothetical protein
MFMIMIIIIILNSLHSNMEDKGIKTSMKIILRVQIKI